jgi:hypothetical protein
LRVGRFTVGVALLRRTLPIAVLLLGCALLGAGIAGVARVDAPLRAAVTEQQQPRGVPHGVDVTWKHHRRGHGDCPPTDPART